MGKDQHIGGPFHPVAGQQPRAQLGIKRGVDVHLTFVDEIMIARVEDLQRRAQTFARPFALIAELAL